MSLSEAVRAAPGRPGRVRPALAGVDGGPLRGHGRAAWTEGAEVFDYGNSLRAEAALGGFERAFDYPGFIPAYIRPLFCEGKGPFRWAALSGNPADIAATDDAVLDMFSDDARLVRWVTMARERVRSQGLPARICWLGYGERDRAGQRFNDMVASGALEAPIVIGRDHLDCGSVASPYRETEAMLDGSDAIADWPLLNALVNTASGASWVSIHHGGGVGIGRSIHAGQVTVADGTAAGRPKLQRVLSNDPAMGILRHVDAGYEKARRDRHRARRTHPHGRPSRERGGDRGSTELGTGGATAADVIAVARHAGDRCGSAGPRSRP